MQNDHTERPEASEGNTPGHPGGEGVGSEGPLRPYVQLDLGSGVRTRGGEVHLWSPPNGLDPWCLGPAVLWPSRLDATSRLPVKPQQPKGWFGVI